eukprot:Awhi_evm1s8980
MAHFKLYVYNAIKIENAVSNHMAVDFSFYKKIQDMRMLPSSWTDILFEKVELIKFWTLPIQIWQSRAFECNVLKLGGRTLEAFQYVIVPKKNQFFSKALISAEYLNLERECPTSETADDGENNAEYLNFGLECKITSEYLNFESE